MVVVGGDGGGGGGGGGGVGGCRDCGGVVRMVMVPCRLDLS